MDSDITPIFENHNDPPQQPMVPEEDNESTPLEELMAPQQPEHLAPEPQNSYGPPPMQNPYYYPQPPPQALPTQQPPQWDPFKNISTSTWIILLVAFVLGFFIGKYK